MEQKEIVIDTDVFIEYLRKNVEVLNILKSFHTIAITSITAHEIKYQAKDKKQLKELIDILNLFEIYTINNRVEDIFNTIFNKYLLSHKPAVQDTYIASICIYNNVPLLTLNKKDYRYIKELKQISHSITPMPRSKGAWLDI